MLISLKLILLQLHKTTARGSPIIWPAANDEPTPVQHAGRQGLIGINVLSNEVPLVSLIRFVTITRRLGFQRTTGTLNVDRSDIDTHIGTLRSGLNILLFRHRTQNIQLASTNERFVRHIATNISRLSRTIGATR